MKKKLCHRVWHGICSVMWVSFFAVVKLDVRWWILFYKCLSCFTMVKQDVRWEPRFSSENGSFCENDGFSVVNPVLGLKPALSADKIVFFLWNKMYSSKTGFTNMVTIIISCNACFWLIKWAVRWWTETIFSQTVFSVENVGFVKKLA